MKRFALYIASLLLIVLLLQFGFEYLYTKVYNTGSYRNTVMWIRDMKQDTLDFAIFGSSRAKYMVHPGYILKETGKKGSNFGINGSNPLEIKMAVKEFLKQNHTDTVFVQVDQLYNLETPDDIGRLYWLPYIHEQEIYEAFSPYGREYYWYRHLPFYRYQKFDSQLGYRNMVMSLIGEDPGFSKDSGFIAMEGELTKETPFSYLLDTDHNIHFEALNEYCRKKGIVLIYFTAPMYRAEESFQILEEKLPRYYNFSDSLQDRALYSDHTHLNAVGAKKFTELFIATFFFNEKEAGSGSEEL